MVVCKAGSCVPGDANAYEGIIYKQKGGWCLNQHCGKYQFDSTSGWLLVENEKVGQFSCKRLQKDPLNLTTDAVWKLRDYFHILSSEIISEMQKEDNAGALFVVPAQFNGAEYPSDTRVVHDVEEYTKDPSHSGSRAQLAAHPAAAQFLLDNAATVDHPKGINAVDEIATMDGLDVVNGYMKISSNSNSENEERKQKTLEELKQRLNSLRLLVMDHVTTEGLLPDLQHFATSKHTVGLVYASALVEDVDDDVQAEYRSQVAEQMLIAQYLRCLEICSRNHAEGSGVDTTTHAQKGFSDAFRTPQREELLGNYCQEHGSSNTNAGSQVAGNTGNCSIGIWSRSLGKRESRSWIDMHTFCISFCWLFVAMPNYEPHKCSIFHKEATSSSGEVLFKGL